MNNFIKDLLTAICISNLFFGFSFAEVSVEEKMWVESIRPFYSESKISGIKLSISIAVDQVPGNTPAFTIWNDITEECRLVVAVRNNPSAQIIMAIGRNEREREIGRIAIYAHEYGHCLQNIAKINSKKNSDGEGKGNYLNVHSRFDEAVSDVFALAWIAKNRPEDFKIALRFFDELRTKVYVNDYNERYEVQIFLDKAKDLQKEMSLNNSSPIEVALRLVFDNFKDNNIVAISRK